jgi:hypothetical protein
MRILAAEPPGAENRQSYCRPVARDDQRHQIPGHGLTGVTVSSWVKNPGFPMEIRAPGTAVKIARSSVEVFSQGQSVRTPSCLSKHLSRKTIASTPELANRAPFPVVIDSFLMGAPDYIIGHYDRERTMILDEFHNFLANADVFSNIPVKHMPGAHLFRLCIF